jgi:uncharacterized protein YdhG (YjbR/CyaY superfamily)
MLKTQFWNHMAMKKYTSVDDYLADQEGIHLSMLEDLIKLILDVAPEAKPGISYGMPAYNLNGIIGGFSAYKNHVSFYPFAGDVIELFREDLKGYKLLKGTLQIGIDQEIPSEVIKAILREKIRRQENR